MTERPTLLLATGNAHKVGEIAKILEAHLDGCVPRLLSAADFPNIPEPEENGASFLENALIKAHAWAEATRLPALADDSGLAVDALDGAPGIRSARYAETPVGRIERVLREMQDVERERRTARFACVAALVAPGGGQWHFEGAVEGFITLAQRGEGGFGYDPIFELADPRFGGLTMAEIGEDTKNEISHRGRAMAAIAPMIGECLKIFRGNRAVDKNSP